MLSPLNFSGLVAHSNKLMSDPHERRPAKRLRTAIECFKCPDCHEVFEDEDEAIECCEDEESEKAIATMCPVCGANATDPRAATNCCLWKDIPPHTRYAMADRVQAGEPWPVVLGLSS